MDPTRRAKIQQSHHQRTLPSNPQDLFAPGAVQEIQRALNKEGYKVASINGRLDESTAAALRRFQSREGLAKTGVPDRETLKMLGLNPERLYLKKEAGETRPPERSP